MPVLRLNKFFLKFDPGHKKVLFFLNSSDRIQSRRNGGEKREAFRGEAKGTEELSGDFFSHKDKRFERPCLFGRKPKTS
jgi:hypothetical protein